MKSTLNIHWKDRCWSSNILVTWGKELTHWKRSWCWERLKAKEKWVAEDEMVGWHHQLNGHEFKQILRDSEIQGSLACWRPWSCRVRHNLATKQQQQNIFNLDQISLLCEALIDSTKQVLHQSSGLSWATTHISNSDYFNALSLLLYVHMSSPDI